MNIISALMTLVGIAAISFAVFGILEAVTAPPEDKNSIDKDYFPK
jgi:hypothetical protein